MFVFLAVSLSRAQDVPEPSGSLTIDADYATQTVGEKLPFDGSFVAGNGLTVDFTSTVTYTEAGWTAEAVIGFGGKQVAFTHTMDLYAEDGGVVRMVDLTPGLDVEAAYGLAVGDLAAELLARFPEPPHSEAIFGEEPLGRGVDPGPIGVNKALLRDAARLIGRWEVSGLLDLDDGDGPTGLDWTCDATGACIDEDAPPRHLPDPTPTPTPGWPGPTDTLTQIDCANRCIGDADLFNGEAVRHTAEHDYVTPRLLPAGGHCDIVQNEVCGQTQVTFAGQVYHYCTGRCGIVSTSSPFPTCNAWLYGRSSFQDCLDADSCIVRHELGGSGVGTQGCETVERQAIDDEAIAFLRDLPYYALSVFDPTPFPVSILTGSILDALYEQVEECTLPDSGKNHDPVTVEGTSCVCPVKDGQPTPFCTATNTCVYPNLVPGFCTHAPCDGKVGRAAPLAEGCDTGIPGDPASVVTRVCAADPYCCATDGWWDRSCREQAIDLGLSCP